MTTQSGLEKLLANELKSLGIKQVQVAKAGVNVQGDLAVGYKACLWSRLASRVLLVLDTFSASDKNSIYKAIQSIDWAAHFSLEKSFAILFTGTNAAINNTHFGALLVKDAIVDQFRDKYGERPNVEKDNPDIRIFVHLYGGEIRVGLDLSGESLHRRGYRKQSVTAPLKETLAAGLLAMAGWPAMMERERKEKARFFDPMCGSGTFLIEAMMIAADMAPGLLRQTFGFHAWEKHQADIWQTLLEDAQSRRITDKNYLPAICGFDSSSSAVAAAQTNIEAAGLDDLISVEQQDFFLDVLSENQADVAMPSLAVMLFNPPYGERLNADRELAKHYANIGKKIKQDYKQWNVHMITGVPELVFRMRLKEKHKVAIKNGAIDCQFISFENHKAVDEKNTIPRTSVSDHDDSPSKERPGKEQPSKNQPEINPLYKGNQLSEDARHAFRNRLKKNLRTLGKWAKRNAIDCYRVYDADLPDFSIAIDVYRSNGELWVHAQEYKAPKTIDQTIAQQRLAAAVTIIQQVLDVPFKRVVVKQRQRQTGLDQYERINRGSDKMLIHESGCQFYINLHDYLDTGIFLDYRPVRKLIQSHSKNARFLNLFAYTGTASVYAAAGGAKSIETLDMSNTYLDWAKENMQVNGYVGEQYSFLKADCIKWLDKASHDVAMQGKYDLILFDPPTFSNSKTMDYPFDVQNDHLHMIEKCIKILSFDGVIIFSNNYKKFKMNEKLIRKYSVDDVTYKTTDEDFKRNKSGHKCWLIKRKQ
ncbi:MAG: bifunctional 23S rRNA (guanine(2069)-N(7))-methyltransferase RlmK/23S rRNA (guanine(2445)-N(2))-methyltransferase RlmL [Gammaproteobacteria bacterium]|nr:bifunctional 23S rRNA (guanine(2069)-N(7))-methyltransferase RlmK/23S rRNA (guanine(2445)-N(2))-methyltransferase RlmL [Gammaproteobacteria bacterium]